MLDEVELNTLLLASVVCFFVTFGVKATQSAKENAIKNFVVLLGGITLFALLLLTGLMVLSGTQVYDVIDVSFRSNESNPASLSATRRNRGFRSRFRCCADKHPEYIGLKHALNPRNGFIIGS